MTDLQPLMAGKRGLIMGVANERSIAWAIAKAVHAQGAEVCFTYQGEAFGKRVKPLAESLGSDAAAMAQAQHDIRQSLAHSTAALAQLQDALVEIAEAITTQLAATRP